MGMTPVEAARHYSASARRAGVRKDFAKLVTEPTTKVESSSGYPRLVAALYATTVRRRAAQQPLPVAPKSLPPTGRAERATSERTGQTAPLSQGGAHQKGNSN